MIQDAISLRDTIRVEILKQTSVNRSLAQKIDNLICQFKLPTFGLKSVLKSTYKISDEQAEELVELLDLYFDVKELISDLRKK
jgi:recombinational DNA repair protein RecR